jgi:hypothetical protein
MLVVTNSQQGVFCVDGSYLADLYSSVVMKSKVSSIFSQTALNINVCKPKNGHKEGHFVLLVHMFVLCFFGQNVCRRGGWLYNDTEQCR